MSTQPRRPKWVEEYLDRQAHAQMPVEEQVTIISMPGQGRPASDQAMPSSSVDSPPSLSAPNLSAMPISVEFTGLGDDGRLQEDMPTEMVSTTEGPAMVHEGELKVVMSDGVTVVIPAHELDQTTIAALEVAPVGETALEMPSGERKMVDLNAAGQGILAKVQEYRGKGPEPMDGMATGGAVVQPKTISYYEPVQAKRDTTSEIKFSNNPSALTGSISGEVIPDTKETRTPKAYTDTAATNERGTDGTIRASGGMTIKNDIQPKIKPADNNFAIGEVQTNPTIPPPVIPQQKTYSINEEPIIDTRRGLLDVQEDGTKVSHYYDAEDGGFRDVTKDDVQATQDRIIDAQKTPYERGIDEGYQYTLDTMRGANPLRQATSDRRINEYNASASAASRANLQRLSNAPGMTEGARRMAAMTGERNIDVGAAQLAGQLADSELAAQDAAAQNAINYGMQIPLHEQTMEDNEIRLEESRQRLADSEWQRALSVYDPNTPEGLAALQSMYVDKFGLVNGQPPDLNFLIEKRKQDLLTLEKSELAVEDSRDRLKDTRWTRALQNYSLENPEEVKILQDLYVDIFGGERPSLDSLVADREMSRENDEMVLEDTRARLNDNEWARAIRSYDVTNPDELAVLQDLYVDLFGGPAPSLESIIADAQEAKRQASGSPDARLAELITGRTSKQEMYDDPILRASIAAKLNTNEDDPEVSKEIDRLWTSYVKDGDNQTRFAGNVAALLDDYDRRDLTLQEAKADDDVRWNSALWLGYDPMDLSTKEASDVEAYIAQKWGQMTMPLVERQFDAWANAGLAPPEYYDAKNQTALNPFFEADIQKQLRKLPESAFDEDGNLIDTANFEYPWASPSSMMNYVDFNGNTIEYQDGKLPEGYYDQEVELPGNGTDFFVVDETGEHRPVTFGDAKKVWDNLGYGDKTKYVTPEGEFDAAAFYNDASIWDKPVNPDDPEAPAPGTYGEFVDFLNSESPDAEAMDASLQMLVTGDPDTGEAGYIGRGQYHPDGNTSLAMEDIDPKTQFLYHDENGVPQAGNIGSQKFNYIAYQLSNVFNDGEIMTPAEFRKKWDAIEWRVDEDGRILNFDPEHQQRWGISDPNKGQVSSFRVASKIRDAIPTSKNDRFIGSRHENYLTREAADWLQDKNNQQLREFDGWQWKFTGRFGSDKEHIGDASKNWIEIYDATNDRNYKIPSEDLDSSGWIPAWKIRDEVERQGGGLAAQEPPPLARLTNIREAASGAQQTKPTDNYVHSTHENHLTAEGANWIQKPENQVVRNSDGWLWKFTGKFNSVKNGDTIHPYKNWVEVYDITNDATWRIPINVYGNSSGNLTPKLVENAINDLIRQAQNGNNKNDFSASDDSFYGVGGANNLSNYTGGSVRGNEELMEIPAEVSKAESDAALAANIEERYPDAKTKADELGIPAILKGVSGDLNYKEHPRIYEVLAEAIGSDIPWNAEDVMLARKLLSEIGYEGELE